MPPKRSNLSPRTCDGKRQRTARGKQSAGPSQIAEEQPSRTTKVVAWLKAAFHYDRNKPYNTNPKVTIGRMNNVCKYCGAKKWQGETPGMCCNGGKVKLEVLHAPPEMLKKLLTEDTSDAKHFRQNLWKYNTAFAMTSFGADKDLTNRGFFTTYKVQGQVYHLLGSLLPLPEETPKFLQVYFINTSDDEAKHRCSLNSGVRMNIIQQLQDMLHQSHPYVASFKYALEQMQTPNHKVVINADKRPAGEHIRRFNAPSASEVAIVMVGQQHGKRDIILKHRDNHLTRIMETHRAYDSLQYPLLLPRGEDGYNFDLRQSDQKTGQKTDKSVSCLNFYAFHLMVRGDNFNQILRFREVTSQYFVDMYAKMEAERLRYLRSNQKQLRAELYSGLRDAINTDGNANNVGQRVILPSSFPGSPRYMNEQAQDAMSYVRKHGRPDLFITFTCNPKWEDIVDELFHDQTQYDRHDLTARVFHEKQKKLLWLLKDGKIFGDVACWMYTIEWQKRGLPHSHTLVWLKEKLHPDRIDSIITAELPDQELDPQLFHTISTQMVHGPCGHLNRRAPCMQDGKCIKRFPRPFLQDSQTGQDGYPLYRRRMPENGGQTCKLKIRGGEEVIVTNQWIVPHNQLLCKIFQAHINVESCNSVKSIKYICKYINKGSDMAVFAVEQEGQPIDEIKNYQMGRYISTNEAMWRFLSFPIHQHYPAVVKLAVHLENGQRVYFTEQTARQKTID